MSGSIPKAPPRPEVIRVEGVNNEQDRAELVREAGPSGSVVVHHRVTTQRYLDDLYARGLIRTGMHQAGQQLRDDWEMAGLRVSSAKCRNLDAPLGGYGGEVDLVADEAAWARYWEAMRAVGRMDANVLRRAVVDDEPVEIHCLRAALGRLALHYRIPVG